MSTPAVAIPGYVAGTWSIDTVHSDISIVARHFMLSKVRGHFKEFAGTIVTGENPLESSVNATIVASSIDTNQEQRDGHIRSADFLDVEKFAEITFASTGLRPDGDDFKLDGDLTLHGVTKAVTLNLELSAFGPDPYGGTRVALTAKGSVLRSEFGMTFHPMMETGGAVVSDKLDVNIEIEAVLNQPES
ncbi:MAG TPA: YceI family protein [Pseudonocardiaceae bacterium]|nr:YceI family protein [Pseudonocardiaceae bacterium]